MTTNKEMPPLPVDTPITDPRTGTVSLPWLGFFKQLLYRVGGFIAPTNNQLSTLTGSIMSGNQNIPNGNSSVSVTFTTPYADTTYSVSAHIINVTDGSPVFQPVVITAKSTTGFTASFNAPVDSANYALSWMALKGN